MSIIIEAIPNRPKLYGDNTEPVSTSETALMGRLEIRKQQDDLLNATPDGDPWSLNVPTSLIYVDENGSDLVKTLKP